MLLTAPSFPFFWLLSPPFPRSLFFAVGRELSGTPLRLLG